MLRAMVARILAGGLLVCINIDEEAAGELLEHLSATNYAVSTLDDEELNGMWYGFVQQIRNSSGAHPLLSGYAARILYDKGRISREEMRDTLSFYSSVATHLPTSHTGLRDSCVHQVRYCCWTTTCGSS